MSPTIFIVDDDDAVRDSLKLLLESYGMRVEDYGSVVEFAHHYPPDACGCLILDQHLPEITGLDFLASAKGRIGRLPVIMMTACSDATMRNRAVELGVSAYLEKPVDDEVLLPAIRRAMAHAQRCHKVEPR